MGCYSPKGVLYMSDWSNMPKVATNALVALIYSQYAAKSTLQRQNWYAPTCLKFGPRCMQLQGSI